MTKLHVYGKYIMNIGRKGDLETKKYIVIGY
jgi:hypothetical protein